MKPKRLIKSSYTDRERSFDYDELVIACDVWMVNTIISGKSNADLRLRAKIGSRLNMGRLVNESLIFNKVTRALKEYQGIGIVDDQVDLPQFGKLNLNLEVVEIRQSPSYIDSALVSVGLLVVKESDFASLWSPLVLL